VGDHSGVATLDTDRAGGDADAGSGADAGSDGAAEEERTDETSLLVVVFADMQA
jgi:hypothetical protein